MKHKRFLKGFRYAFEGVIYAAKHELNFNVHILIAILVFIVTLYLNLTITELCIIILTVSLVISAELFNTSIEALTDLVCKGEFSPYAKAAKDAAAGGVLVVSFASIFIGYFIIIRKFLIIFINLENFNFFINVPNYFFIWIFIILCLLSLLLYSLFNFEKKLCMTSILISNLFCLIFFLTSNLYIIFICFIVCLFIIYFKHKLTKIHLKYYFFNFILSFIISYIFIKSLIIYY